MMKKNIKIKNMTCHSCEKKITDELRAVDGVRKVKASYKKGLVDVAGDGFSEEEVYKKISDAGYEIGVSSLPLISKEKAVWLSFFLSLGIVFVIWELFKIFDVGLSIPSLNTGNSLFVPLLIGLAAGFTSCMALVGGLVLGLSAKYAETHPNTSSIKKFTPHIYFNLGRIGGFFALGGMLGLIGSFLKINGVVVGYATIAVSIVLFLLALQLTEIFPKLRFGFRLPSLNRTRSEKYKNTEALIGGLLTFFIPCGFTQAVQLFAIGTGSFMSGALVMSLFALGTAPALLGIGGITSFAKEGKGAKIFFRFIGVLLLFFALYNFKNSVNLLGLNRLLPEYNQNEGIVDKNKWGEPLVEERAVPVVEEGIQVIRATYDNKNVIDPEDFVVDFGTPVRFEIFAKDDGEGCMGSVLIPGLYDNYQFFTKNETLIMEFNPKNSGDYKITCAMGVPAGTLKVK